MENIAEKQKKIRIKQNRKQKPEPKTKPETKTETPTLLTCQTLEMKDSKIQNLIETVEKTDEIKNDVTSNIVIESKDLDHPQVDDSLLNKTNKLSPSQILMNLQPKSDITSLLPLNDEISVLNSTNNLDNEFLDGLCPELHPTPLKRTFVFKPYNLENGNKLDFLVVTDQKILIDYMFGKVITEISFEHNILTQISSNKYNEIKEVSNILYNLLTKKRFDAKLFVLECLNLFKYDLLASGFGRSILILDTNCQLLTVAYPNSVYDSTHEMVLILKYQDNDIMTMTPWFDKKNDKYLSLLKNSGKLNNIGYPSYFVASYGLIQLDNNKKINPAARMNLRIELLEKHDNFEALELLPHLLCKILRIETSFFSDLKINKIRWFEEFISFLRNNKISIEFLENESKLEKSGIYVLFKKDFSYSIPLTYSLISTVADSEYVPLGLRCLVYVLTREIVTDEILKHYSPTLQLDEYKSLHSDDFVQGLHTKENRLMFKCTYHNNVFYASMECVNTMGYIMTPFNMINCLYIPITIDNVTTCYPIYIIFFYKRDILPKINISLVSRGAILKALGFKVSDYNLMNMCIGRLTEKSSFSSRSTFSPFDLLEHCLPENNGLNLFCDKLIDIFMIESMSFNSILKKIIKFIIREVKIHTVTKDLKIPLYKVKKRTQTNHVSTPDFNIISGFPQKVLNYLNDIKHSSKFLHDSVLKCVSSYYSTVGNKRLTFGNYWIDKKTQEIVFPCHQRMKIKYDNKSLSNVTKNNIRMHPCMVKKRKSGIFMNSARKLYARKNICYLCRLVYDDYIDAKICNVMCWSSRAILYSEGERLVLSNDMKDSDFYTYQSLNVPDPVFDDFGTTYLPFSRFDEKEEYNSNVDDEHLGILASLKKFIERDQL